MLLDFNHTWIDLESLDVVETFDTSEAFGVSTLSRSWTLTAVSDGPTCTQLIKLLVDAQRERRLVDVHVPLLGYTLLSAYVGNSAVRLCTESSPPWRYRTTAYLSEARRAEPQREDLLPPDYD